MDIWFLALFGFAVYLMILFFLPETLRYLVGNCACYKDTSIIVKPHLRQKKLLKDIQFLQNQVSKIIGS